MFWMLCIFTCLVHTNTQSQCKRVLIINMMRILTDFFFWYSFKMLLIRSFSWNKRNTLLDQILQSESQHAYEPGQSCTIWLEGLDGRFCITSSISSNFLAMAWTSACSSLYSAYWSLNTALYWSLSSSEQMLGYFLKCWLYKTLDPVLQVKCISNN